MNITLTANQEAFVRRAVEQGRYENAEDAVTEALLLWEERELRRADFLASLDAAEADLDRGGGIPIDATSMKSAAEDVKRQGRERLAAERRRPG